MGTGGKRKNFFSREKKPKRRLRYIFISLLVRRSLVRRRISFSKGAVSDKGRWFLGKGKTSFLVKRSFPLPQTPTLFKKSEVFYKVRTIPYG